MTNTEQKAAAKRFAEKWKGRSYEKGESQSFWLSLLRDVLGVEQPEEFITFEEQVHLDHTSFIDGFIPSTRVLIEQKSLGKDLRKGIRQSDGSLLTPFQQAKRYITELPVSQHPRWVVTCNFSSFLVYDMEKPTGEPEEILLENLDKEYYRLSFLVEQENQHLKREMEISIQAGDIVGLLYDEILKQYKDPTNEHSLKSLNMLCVRLVFCLYAEDAGIFGKKGMFHDYISGFDVRNMRKAIIELFQVLDTEVENRDPYLDTELAAFPYVNGGLFSDENIEIPQFTEHIREVLLSKASEDFDWSEISPTIFGAVFESTLNPETRRKGGMHYTSIENIHKVIDPLFLDSLKEELEEIKEVKTLKTRSQKLEEYQKKLSELKFLDPACGSGNFLTETYISLRRLENEAISLLNQGQILLGSMNPIKVSIGQFYGIEINDFAVTVAKTALWIAESQMMKETEEIVHMNLDFLPLKSYANIVEGNALRIDWESVTPKRELNYIMGNPPFVGTKLMSKAQKNDSKKILSQMKNYGVLDYVACWYKKAADYITNTLIQCAFVSTNSICQGEQVSILWKPLFSDGLKINFAYRTFRWDSEANIKAHVHCIIVGFSKTNNINSKKIFDNGRIFNVKEINPYLVDADIVFVDSRKTPLCNVPHMYLGCDYKDGDYYIFTETEKNEFIRKEPKAAKFIRPYMTGRDFINRKPRYCLWFKNCKPEEIKGCPQILERIKKVKEFRENSDSPDTKRYADYPMRPARLRYYSEDWDCDALALPRISSQMRRYVPMELMPKEIIGGASILMMPNADLYTFGVLISNVHMSWMRAVCGRMKSDYRYSSSVVYNNFPWPTPTEAQKAKIEKTAQAILDARALYPDSSLADLYDEVTMPPELRKAHQQNDKAVMEAYGFTKDTEAYKNESACVAELMKMYQRLTENNK